jgi:hypothetical protein
MDAESEEKVLSIQGMGTLFFSLRHLVSTYPFFEYRRRGRSGDQRSALNGNSNGPEVPGIKISITHK